MSSKENKNPAWRTIADLQKLGLKELRKEYEKVFGKETKSRSRKYLFTVLAKKMQEPAGQAKSEKHKNSVLTTEFRPKRKRPKKSDQGSSNKQQTSRKRQSRPLGEADPRLPKAGTIITKDYKGKKIRVKVLENGFDYSGKHYRSLSGIAREITGSIWNGFLFFGLAERKVGGK